MGLDPRAIDILRSGPAAVLTEPAFRHADLGLFTEAEAAQLDALVALVADYLRQPDPPRPLCVAVFGAPGSGKSRLAKALPGLLARRDVHGLAPLVEINLTQVTAIPELATAVAATGAQAGGAVPLVFFDEFDTSRAGAPWGWLSWFLAPMHDGVFLAGGVRVVQRRAVYVFAGGTAHAFDAFGRGDAAGFVAAKGPDFVSRLRGYVDIPGVNTEDAEQLRRAAVLAHLLRIKGKAIDDGLRDALLLVGRYKHGARSLEALVELLPRGVATLADLQAHALTRMHVDRGALDPNLIGGAIGLSAGGDRFTDDPQPALAAVTEALFREGATVAYGGSLTTRASLTVVGDVAQPLTESGDTWIVTTPEPHAPALSGVVRLERPGADDDDVPADLPPALRRRWHSGLGLFRLRYMLALRSVGQFAVAGRLDHPAGTRTKRFPGVVEELMLALALGHPVYVAGGFRGAAEWAGRVLGLGRTWRGRPPGLTDAPLPIPPSHHHLFRPPPHTDLPLTPDELIGFFERRALGGPGWIDNGLGPEDNRRLFETTDAAEIARLVVTGLRRRFARDA